MSGKLKGKKILFLSANFFDYPEAVTSALISQGAEVVYRDERPANNFSTKVAIRLGLKFFIRKKINNYYSFILNSKAAESLDYIFLISPETPSVDFLNKIKDKNPSVKIIVYMWDSLANKKGAKDILNIADKAFSFDRNDVDKYPKLNFLPLFYREEYSSIETDAVQDIDILFIGTIHSDRYIVAKKIEELATNLELNTFFYFYSPSRTLFKIKKILDRNFRCVDESDVSFTPLGKRKILELITRSKAVLDIEHPGQSGLTMRTVEILGAKRKLLTTNVNVKEYDFFDSERVIVIDRYRPDFFTDMIRSPYKNVDVDTYLSYSLNSWVNAIFNK